MHDKGSLEEHCRKILEDNGGMIADKARTILLEDPALKDLRCPLEFISKNWRAPQTPALMSLSCRAVGGKSEETYETGLAMSLLNLGFYILDDIIDKVAFKLFKPTVFGKFGESTALIISGLASAKAFSILNQLERAKRQTVIQMFWGVCTKMAQAETVNLKSRSQKGYSSIEKFKKIEDESSADLSTCMKIGAILGNGSESEILHLGRYGLFLGIITELWKDFHVSVNLTLELAEKIKSRTPPFSLLWASERSKKVQKKIDSIANKERVEETDVRQLVENLLETRALDNVVRIMRRYAKKGEGELAKVQRNEASQTLRVFITAQPQLFIESISASQEYER